MHSQLPKGCRALGNVHHQDGQAEKLLRKPYEREDKKPAELVVKGSSFNVAVKLDT